jgi:hypothetical protein
MVHEPLSKQDDRELSRQSHIAKIALTEIKRRRLVPRAVPDTPFVPPEKLDTYRFLLLEHILHLEQLQLKAPLLGLERARLFWCKRQLAQLDE